MRALVLSSGGVDSTTCLGMAVDKYGKENVVSLSVFYGQKHTKELEAATKVAKYYGVEHMAIDLSLIFKDSDCSLLTHSTEEIPHESMLNSLKRLTESLCQLMYLSETDFFLQQRQVLLYQKNVMLYITGHMRMTQRATLIPIAVRCFIMP